MNGPNILNLFETECCVSEPVFCLTVDLTTSPAKTQISIGIPFLGILCTGIFQAPVRDFCALKSEGIYLFTQFER